MESVKTTCETRMKKTIAALRDEFNGIRTGRASPSLLDKIRVDYYGQKTPLSQVATISCPSQAYRGPPWDRALFSEIEKAILKSELGLNPSNDGKVIRLAIPPSPSSGARTW
jgi:ribosome recycling factor